MFYVPIGGGILNLPAFSIDNEQLMGNSYTYCDTGALEDGVTAREEYCWCESRYIWVAEWNP